MVRDRRGITVSKVEGAEAEYWNGIFETKAIDDVSWFQTEPVTSLRLLSRWSSPGASLIDVGGGTSTLVDALLDDGRSDVTVLDVSEAAIALVRQRLGARAERVTFVAADIRTWRPTRAYDAWHDRAVFHFLVEPADRDHYVRTASEAIASGGVLVVATFAGDGPTECSGLPTRRYDSEELVRAFGPAFVVEHSEREEHTTPFGTVQPFTWVVLRRR